MLGHCDLQTFTSLTIHEAGFSAFHLVKPEQWHSGIQADKLSFLYQGEVLGGYHWLASMFQQSDLLTIHEYK